MNADQTKTKELFENLISIKSVFPEEKEVCEYVERYLLEIGLHVERVYSAQERFNLVAWNGEHPRYLGFYGHLDTVPPALDYERDPYSIRWDGSIAKGLGTSDMKGGVTCILRAAEIVAQENLPVKVILGVDEENISVGANDLAKSEYLRDVAFLISAEGARLIDEEQVITSVFGRKGRIVLDVLVQGQAAHAADADQGVNAITQAARLMLALDELTFPIHGRMGSTQLLVEAINSEASAYSLPEQCMIRVSALTSPGTSSEDCIHAITECAQTLSINAQVHLHPRPTPYSESYEIDLNDAFLQKIQEEILNPLQITAQYSGSVADENVFARELAIPVLCLGARGAGIHQAHEWVDFDSMLKLIEVYQTCMRSFARMS